MLRAMYRWGSSALLIIWLFFLVLIGAKFTEQNPHLLQVTFLWWSLPESSAGLALCVALCLGVVLGLLCIFPALFIFKAKMKRLKSKLSKAEKKLENMATSVPMNISN